MAMALPNLLINYAVPTINSPAAADPPSTTYSPGFGMGEMVTSLPNLLINYDADMLYFWYPRDWPSIDLKAIVSRLFPQCNRNQVKQSLKHIAGNSDFWDETTDQINDVFLNLEEVLFVSYDMTHYRPRNRLIRFEDANYLYDSEWYHEAGGHDDLCEQGEGKPWHWVDVVVAYRVGVKR